jgi:hypothetical protein
LDWPWRRATANQQYCWHRPIDDYVQLLKDILDEWQIEVSKKPETLSLEECFETLGLAVEQVGGGWIACFEWHMRPRWWSTWHMQRGTFVWVL